MLVCIALSQALAILGSHDTYSSDLSQVDCQSGLSFTALHPQAPPTNLRVQIQYQLNRSKPASGFVPQLKSAPISGKICFHC